MIEYSYFAFTYTGDCAYSGHFGPGYFVPIKQSSQLTNESICFYVWEPFRSWRLVQIKGLFRLSGVD